MRGIANTPLKIEGTVTLKLFSPSHETSYTFHAMGDNFDCRYNAILDHDVCEKKTTISYCDCEIVTGDVIIKFDLKTNRIESEPYKLTLKPRTESAVELPTTYPREC
jgi:hypothetical protein